MINADVETIGFCVGVAGVGAVLLFSGGGESLKGLASSGEQIKALREDRTLRNVLIKTENEMQRNESALALERYQGGCVVHTVKAANQNPEHTAVGSMTVEYRKVVEGQTHSDYLGTAYSPGTVLCDAWGGTGIVGEGGVLESFAYTGDDITAYVTSHFERY